tara:strand:+ start:144 stop:380 length:237 start_codon:yes stop_codon:yes gene_type:complete
MKKLIIGIGALGVMSFTTNQLYYGTQLLWAMDNLNDMQEYVYEDMVNGKIDEATAENYNELLGETQSFIQDFYEKQCH